MLSFKQYLEDHEDPHEDPNGELQAGMAASGANTVMDGTPVRQKFMSSDKTTITGKGKPIWKAATGHKAYRGGAGTHGDRRLGRLKTRGNQNKKAIDNSSE